jgi:hypothetical protein
MLRAVRQWIAERFYACGTSHRLQFSNIRAELQRSLAWKRFITGYYYFREFLRDCGA